MCGIVPTGFRKPVGVEFDHRVRQLKQTAKNNITYFNDAAIQNGLSFAVPCPQQAGTLGNGHEV